MQIAASVAAALLAGGGLSLVPFWRRRALEEASVFRQEESWAPSEAECPPCFCEPQPPAPESAACESTEKQSGRWATAGHTAAGLAAGAYVGHRRRDERAHREGLTAGEAILIRYHGDPVWHDRMALAIVADPAE